MGLLDTLNSPAGMGLLSALAGGLAGARRGQPINNIGRGAVAGLTGYANAQDQVRQDEENALQRQFRDMQMGEIQRKAELDRANREYRAKLPDVIAQNDPNAINQYLLQDPGLEAKDALKFLNPNAIGSDAPSNVREWEYYKNLPEPQQLKYLEMKRALGWQDMGGYAAPRMPGGTLGPAIPKTMPPQATVSADQRQRELDYTTPKPKPAQQIGVTDP